MLLGSDKAFSLWSLASQGLLILITDKLDFLNFYECEILEAMLTFDKSSSFFANNCAPADLSIFPCGNLITHAQYVQE